MVTAEEHERRMKYAREKTRLAWCQPSTIKIARNSVLAEEFAKILVIEMYASHLGCASTKELLEECMARMEGFYKTVPDEGPR